MSKPPAPSDIADKFMLRLPDGMRDRLKAAAEVNKRSMNAEIVARLEGSLDPAAGPQDFATAIMTLMKMAKSQDITLKLVVGEDPDEPSDD